MSEETTSYWLCVYKDKPVVYYWMAWSSWHLSLWLHFQLSRLGLSNVSVHCLKQTNQWDCTWNNTQPTIKPPCRASATPPETLFFCCCRFLKTYGKLTLPVSCVLAPLGWWAHISRFKNSTISSLRATLGLISIQTYSMEGSSSSPRWHTLIRQFMAADLKKMLRAETRCSNIDKCFSCLTPSQEFERKKKNNKCSHLI